MSLAALQHLKKKFSSVTFFGCEPPVKQAMQYTVSKPLLVATEFTVEAVRKNYPGGQISCCALPNLASMIENAANEREILIYLDNELKDFNDFDCIVLGCTHYSLAKNCFNQLFPGTKIFDSVDGAYSVAKKLFGKNKARNESTLKFEFSSNAEENTLRYEKMLQEIFKYY